MHEESKTPPKEDLVIRREQEGRKTLLMWFYLWPVFTLSFASAIGLIIVAVHYFPSSCSN
jgi:hypothetical protein